MSKSVDENLISNITVTSKLSNLTYSVRMTSFTRTLAEATCRLPRLWVSEYSGSGRLPHVYVSWGRGMDYQSLISPIIKIMIVILSLCNFSWSHRGIAYHWITVEARNKNVRKNNRGDQGLFFVEMSTGTTSGDCRCTLIWKSFVRNSHFFSLMRIDNL